MQLRAERAWTSLAGLGVLLMAAVYALVPADAVARSWAYALVSVPLIAGAAFACARRARASAASERRAWFLLAAASAAWAVGEVGWVTLDLLGRTPPTPHWTDVLYLLNVPLMVAGLLGLAWRPGTTRQTLVRVLDALFVASAVLLIGWVTFLRAFVADTAEGGLTVAVAVAYPIGDLAILVAFGLAIARLSRERMRQLWPLLAGAAIIGVADAGFTWVYLATGTYIDSWFDLLWPLGAAGIGWAALRPGQAGIVHQGPPRRIEQWMPTALLAAAVVAVATDYVARGGIDDVTFAIAIAGASLLTARQAGLVDLHLRLVRNLDAAQRLAGVAAWRWRPRDQAMDLGETGPGLFGIADGRTLAPVAEVTARVHADDRDQLQRSLDALVSRGEAVDLVVRVPLPDGERHLQVRGQRTAGAVHGTLVDVSAQVRLQQEQTRAQLHQAEAERLGALAKAKAQFINTAAHELITPLTPIRLSLANLRSGRPSRGGDPLALLERNVERLTRLLSDVLDGARLQSDRLRLRLEEVDLATLVREAVEEHGPAAAHANVALHVEAPTPVPVDGDATRLHEVVMNLLSNALKFTAPGGHVEVTVRRDGDRAILRVRDDGRGISEADLALLFQPFTQVGERNREGTGLGLYISRGIVEQHAGHLVARSDGLGQGAFFEMDLPLRAAPAPPPTV